MASMLKSKGAGTGNLYHLGCSCCNTKPERRAAKRPAKRKEERSWKEDQRNNS